MNSILKNSFIMSAVFTVLVTAGCNKNSTDQAYPSTPTKEIQLKAHPTLGNILTDKDGHSLYFFSNDANGQNTCTGGCEALWPVFNIDNLTSEKLGDGLSLNDFSAATTTAGKRQVSFKGWPLYYFAPTGGVQEQAGATSGEGVGGVWFVAKPDYSIMIANSQMVGHDGKNSVGNYTEGAGKTIYYTDGTGHTLYTFIRDSANKNKFTKADFSNNSIWPICETDKVVVPSTLNKSLFGSIDVFGKKQLTFKGWPLYYFGQDGTTRGNNKGISFPTPGIWPVPVTGIQVAP
jgi:predicted lipoprotein with Yx(FWY)xxD motif